MLSNDVTQDKAMVTECLAGSEEGWREFVARFGSLVAATAYSVSARCQLSRDEVDDLVGHVYEKLLEDGYRRVRAWRGQARFSTYLVQVTKNLCIDYIKKQHRGRRMNKDGELPEWMVSPRWDGASVRPLGEAEMAALRAAIEALPTTQALIMRLRLQGQSLRQVARLLNIPEGTVFVQNSRAIQELRTVLKDLHNLGEETDIFTSEEA